MRRATPWWIPWGALLAASPVVVVLERSHQRMLLTLLVVPAIFLGLHSFRRWAASTRAAFFAFLLLTGAVFCTPLALEVRKNLDVVREWDFLGFWLHARTALRGADFYDPGNAAESAAALSVSSDFRREIIDTGFWYPPPSMFLFLPLGWFDPETALVLWYGFNILVMATDVLLLWRIFFPRGSVAELAACATLLAAVGGTRWNFYFAQTSFVALLALLLFWPRQRSAWGGVWVVVATFVKPFLAVLGLCLLVGAKRRALAGVAAALVVFCLASAAAFGPLSFGRYITAPEAKAKPDWVYSQDTNQSVLGFVLRATKTRCSGIACVKNPLFLGVAAILTAITIPLGARLARARAKEHAREHPHGELTVALYLLLALLVYPVSQVFYSVLLVPLLLLVWRYRDRVLGGAGTMAALAAIVYALTSTRYGDTTVGAFALLWAAIALLGLALVRGKGWPLRPDPRPLSHGHRWNA